MELTDKEREEKFYEIACKAKDNLLKSAEPIKKMAYDNSFMYAESAEKFWH